LKKAKEKNYFRKICAKKVRFKIDQQQNGQSQKGPQQNGPRKSGRIKRRAFGLNCLDSFIEVSSRL